jgi:hypothetical protein
MSCRFLEGKKAILQSGEGQGYSKGTVNEAGNNTLKRDTYFATESSLSGGRLGVPHGRPTDARLAQYEGTVPE